MCLERCLFNLVCKNCNHFPAYSLCVSAHHIWTDRVRLTCDRHSFLVGAGVAGAGHDHCDCRAVLVPHGGVGGQRPVQGVQQHLIQVALEQGQQHLRGSSTESEGRTAVFFFFLRQAVAEEMQIRLIMNSQVFRHACAYARARHTHLTLWVSQATVEFEDLWPLLGQHESCIQHAWKRGEIK